MTSPVVDTADQIVAAATQILRAEGAGAVSMRRVGDALGISAMTPYRHFANRDALLSRIADDGFTALASSIPEARLRRLPPRRRLLALLDAYLDFALEEPHWYDCMFTDVRAGARQFPDDFVAGHSPTATLVARAVDDGIADGTFAPGDVWSITLSIAAMAHGLIALHRGARIAGDTSVLRTLYRTSLERLLNGIAS
jgi:AcrR family transcriptional regulator